MYRTGFAHPLSLVHQCSKLLAETIYFVCSVRVGSLQAYTNRQSTPRAQFVCPCSLFSVDRLVLQSFTQFVCDISKGSSRPSAIIDDSNNFAPVLPFGQFAPFSVAPTSRRTVIVILQATASGRLCPRRVSCQQRHFDNLHLVRRSNLTRRGVYVRSFRSPRGAPQQARQLCSCSCSRMRGRLTERQRQ